MAEIQMQKKVNAAEELKKSLTLPDPPANRCKWEQAQGYFNLLTEEQKEMIKWYLYRQKPAIIKQKPFYIQEPSYGIPDYDTIVAMHGGGNYRMDIQDAGKSKKMMEVFLTIPMSTAPKIDLEELDMNDPSNKGFINQLIADGKINRDGQVVQPNSSNNTTSGLPDAMIKMQDSFMNAYMRMTEAQQRQLIEAGNKKDDLGGTVGAILIEKMKQDNPNGLLPILIEAMKTKNSATEFAPIFTVMTTMMTQMSTMQAENMKMVVELMKEKNNGKEKEDDELGGGTFIEKMKSMIELAGMIKGGKVAERSTLETVVDGVSAVLPSVMQTINGWLNFAAMQRQGMAGVPMPNISPSGAPMPNMAQEMPSLPPPANVVEMPKPTPGQPVPPPTGENMAAAQLGQLLQLQGGLIFSHLEREGDLFADVVIGMFGKPAWAMMAKMSVDEIVTVAKSAPQFWNQVASTYGEPYFREWITQFKNWEVLSKQEEEQIQNDNEEEEETQ